MRTEWKSIKIEKKTDWRETNGTSRNKKLSNRNQTLSGQVKQNIRHRLWDLEKSEVRSKESIQNATKRVKAIANIYKSFRDEIEWLQKKVCGKSTNKSTEMMNIKFRILVTCRMECSIRSCGHM